MLATAGIAVRRAVSVAAARDAYEGGAFTAVICDSQLPGGGGGHLTELIRAEDPEASVIVIAHDGTVDEAVALMRNGAFHVLKRPLASEEIQLVVERALEQRRLARGHRDLQQQVDLNEKLAMIGRLASGVAHELNNPLDGVRRFVRMTQEGLSDEKPELNDYLDNAMRGLIRMTGIVRQLLTFSRNVTIENERENLRTMLNEVVRTLAPSGSSGAVIDVDDRGLDIPVPRVLFQVLVNLIKNALHAVEDRGARGQVRISVQREDESFEIAVTDNGTGISEQDLRRIFEPFFTTKEVGKGTGLGLPISARIAERCGGSIRVVSEPGKGTTFSVSMPTNTAVHTGRQLHGANHA